MRLASYMSKLKRRVVVVSVTLVFLALAAFFIYPQITGFATIEADFLEEDGWVLDEVKALENGQTNYYENHEVGNYSLIIRTRTFETLSEAMNKFAYNFNLDNTRDPVYFKYKDGAFHTIYFNKFQGKGPWLTLMVRDGQTMTEFIYANQKEMTGWEYSGDYDADILWLTSTAIRVIGE